MKYVVIPLPTPTTNAHTVLCQGILEWVIGALALALAGESTLCGPDSEDAETQLDTP